MKPFHLGLTVATLFAISLATHAATVRLDELDLSAMSAGWGEPQKNLSITGKPLTLAGQTFSHGVGTHAESELTIQLDGKTRWFTAHTGVDDHAANAAASIEFIIRGDHRILWQSGICKLGDQPRDCYVKLGGIKHLELVVTNTSAGINYDHADWADAAFEYDGAAPKTVKDFAPAEKAVLLTPPAPRRPSINGPKVYGVRPGSPFLYRIPCTGDRPIIFRAEGLPAGLTLDSTSGIITGSIVSAGTNQVTLFARNTRGESKREFAIVAGDTLALTPPMGWNSWYIHYTHVTEATMRQAADQMIASGMADYGYQYVNIDDGWMVQPGAKNPELAGPVRAVDGTLLPNKRFPNITGMVDYIHAKGLKAGIYISPGPTTCAGFEGSWQHEAQDARTFAAWGFDFLKYDWCSYGEESGGNTVADFQKPYQVMSAELRKQNRDLIFNLCQYGMGQVWKWGGDVGQCWRTTGDLGYERDTRLPGFYNIAFQNAALTDYARPGGWNDPDYLLLGWIGGGHGSKPTTLTPNEQYSYMSLWALMASPLVFSGDMAKLDPFTLNVLCNSEVIEVDQDILGRQAKVLRRTADEWVLVKDLADGSKAVGLLNLSDQPAKLAITWADLGLTGRQRVHDVWRQKDLGKYRSQYETKVPRHGVALLRLTPAP